MADSASRETLEKIKRHIHESIQIVEGGLHGSVEDRFDLSCIRDKLKDLYNKIEALLENADSDD